MVKVSIIIPAYNAEKFIAETIKSAINQTLKDIEIIIVNDASNDKTLEVSCKFAKKDSRIRVISHKKNKKRSESTRECWHQRKNSRINKKQ